MKKETPRLSEQYDIKVFSAYSTKGVNPSYLARMHNILIKAVTDRTRLPKAIIIVMEDNLIIDSGAEPHGEFANAIFKESTMWLVDNYAKTVNEYWQLLPSKSRKDNYTKFLWIAAPVHKNFRNNVLRKKFNSALYQATSARRSMNTVKLKADWDFNNFRLVSNGNLTGTGLLKYWEAIDAAFHFWQSVILTAKVVPSKPDGVTTARKSLFQRRNGIFTKHYRQELFNGNKRRATANQ